MSTLILHLPPSAPTATTEWPYVLSPDGSTLGVQGQAPASLLPTPSRPADTVAVVPVQQLSWHRVTLPKGVSAQHARLPALLAGLLEDQLLDDPAELHLALGPEAAGERWVAACRRDWLASHLQALDGAGHPVTRIVPELWPQASAEPILHLLGNPAEAHWVLVGGTTGAQLRRGPWPREPGDWWPLPDTAQACTDPALAAWAEQRLGRPVPLNTPAQRWLAAAQGPWDLAQQGLARTSPARRRLARGWQALLQGAAWRPVRWGLAAAALVQLAGVNAWAWKERQDWQARQAANRAVLTQSFPAVQVVVDAPLQMQREVDALRQASGQAGGQDLESLLAAVASSAPAGQVPTALDYDGRELKLRGLRHDPAELAPLQDKLRAQGYAARTEGDALLIRQENR